MRIIFIFIIGTVFALQASPELIKIKEHYNGYGVIFNKEYKYPFIQEDYKESFTPSIKQIIKAERILYDNYYQYRTSVLDSFNSNHKLKMKLKDAKKVKKKFFNYYRQYAGYVNSCNDSIIYIGLFNFENKKKASFYFRVGIRFCF